MSHYHNSQPPLPGQVHRTCRAHQPQNTSTEPTASASDTRSELASDFPSAQRQQADKILASATDAEQIILIQNLQELRRRSKIAPDTSTPHAENGVSQQFNSHSSNDLTNFDLQVTNSNFAELEGAYQANIGDHLPWLPNPGQPLRQQNLGAHAPQSLQCALYDGLEKISIEQGLYDNSRYVGDIHSNRSWFRSESSSSSFTSNKYDRATAMSFDSGIGILDPSTSARSRGKNTSSNRDTVTSFDSAISVDPSRASIISDISHRSSQFHITRESFDNNYKPSLALTSADASFQVSEDSVAPDLERHQCTYYTDESSRIRCPSSFSRKADRVRHESDVHELPYKWVCMPKFTLQTSSTFNCPFCSENPVDIQHLTSSHNALPCLKKPLHKRIHKRQHRLKEHIERRHFLDSTCEPWKLWGSPCLELGHGSMCAICDAVIPTKDRQTHNDNHLRGTVITEDPDDSWVQQRGSQGHALQALPRIPGAAEHNGYLVGFNTSESTSGQALQSLYGNAHSSLRHQIVPNYHENSAPLLDRSSEMMDIEGEELQEPTLFDPEDTELFGTGLD